MRLRTSGFTVQNWCYLLLGVLAGIVVVGGAIAAQLQARTTSISDHVITRIQPAQVEAYRLQSALIDQETGSRGYALTADRQFLGPYTTGLPNERKAADAIRRLLPRDSRVIADLAEIEAAAQSWRATYTDPLIGGVTPGEPRPLDRRSAEQARQAFDQIRALFSHQIGDLTASRDTSLAQLDRAQTTRRWVLGSLALAFFAALVAMTLLIRTLVVRPLDRVRTSSRRIADGDFEHEIAVSGPADLRAVASDVEAMRQRIVAELTASREAEHLLAEQAASLDAQALELRRSNAELEQFAYVASHDLQEPLRKVASFCQLLEKRYADELDDRARQYIDFAVDGAKRMQVLIADLLTFSRVGRTTEHEREVSMDLKLDKALLNLESLIEASGARIERPASMPTFTGDPTLLIMLWQNLIGNAIKFAAPDRAPVITITCEPDPDAAGDGWLFAVTDNGIGIPAEFADKVFVIFQRLHSRDAYAGTGIGLALCKKIVDHHGGRIWVDTDHTGGARICFTVPAHAPDRPALSIITEGERA